MKANELRIGNLVKKGDEIFMADFLTIRMAINYESIPLTEEWLVRFGFEKVVEECDGDLQITYDKTITHDLYIRYFDDFSCELLSSKDRVDKDLSVIPLFSICKTVHGLQNIVHSLTGEELTIKDAN
jgi:hypothetical protein